MRLAIDLPIAPMLARLIDDIPPADAVPGGFAYEPKWDGFRCIILRDGDQVELISRMNKQLTRYFPEVVDRVRLALPERCVVDAEIIVRTGRPGNQRLDWDALSARVHPALKRINRLSVQTPAELVCFDLLALDDSSLLTLPYDTRRELLEGLFAGVDPESGVHLTAVTHDADLAREWFHSFEGAGLDGVMVKERRGCYEPGRRSMLKVKHTRTAEAVVVGYRKHARGHGVGSLLLGMYDEGGELVNVGGIGALSDRMREALADELEPLRAPQGEGLILPPTNARNRLGPWDQGAYIPLRPELVVEVSFDQLEGRRFRHAVTLVRFRPDREPRSCTLDQVDVASAYDLGQLLDS
jgi:ATP-dependent DNA ligase